MKEIGRFCLITGLHSSWTRKSIKYVHFFHDSIMPPHLNKFLFKTANGAAYRIALSLYGQEALP